MAMMNTGWKPRKKPSPARLRLLRLARAIYTETGGENVEYDRLSPTKQSKYEELATVVLIRLKEMDEEKLIDQED